MDRQNKKKMTSSYKDRKVTGGVFMDVRLQKDWERFWSDALTFVLLEELEKKDTQTAGEFSDNIKTLKDIWLEKVKPDRLY